MTDRIDLEGIEVYARHGVLPEEKVKAQVFVVDLTVFLSLEEAGETDRLDDTIDYRHLAEEVRETVGGESHQLIERVAQLTAQTVLAHPKADRVRVTIHKEGAQLGVAYRDVSVTVDRSR